MFSPCRCKVPEVINYTSFHNQKEAKGKVLFNVQLSGQGKAEMSFWFTRNRMVKDLEG